MKQEKNMGTQLPNHLSAKPDSDKWRLVWHDEFEGDRLDPDKWTLFDRMFGGKVDTDTDARHIAVEDGCAVMRTYLEGEEHYSTHKTLTTYGRMSFLYGYAEIRARVPFVPGAFPSFWFQSAPQHRKAPYMIECDMFEPYYYGYLEATCHKWYLQPRDDGFGTAYAHDWQHPKFYSIEGMERFTKFWDYSPENPPMMTEEEKKLVEDWNKEFHLFGMEWSADALNFTLDGRVVGTYDLSKDFGEGEQRHNWSKDIELGAKLGTEMTGMSGFTDDPWIINFTNWILGGNFRYGDEYVAGDKTTYPLTFEVDYVRLYQKEGEGKLFDDRGTEVCAYL